MALAAVLTRLPWIRLPVLCAALGLGAPTSAQVIISEFMAANQDTLRDGLGNASDWIELYNASTEPVNLAGWHLTDEATNRTKWTFPPTTLGGRQFLVVFASGNGVPDPLGFLHANFQLSIAGEYLALLEPDGTTLASEFAPAFPAQRTDISFGLPQNSITNQHIVAGAAARFLVPSSGALGTNWQGGVEPFDDTTWTALQSPVGFDASAIPASSNILFNAALGRPVIVPGPSWSGLPPENLTDGNLSTFTHNLNTVSDWSFIVDLGSTVPLENIELFNRNDGCCPDRLSNFTVSIHGDTGPTIGPAVWSANVRTNNSNSGVGGRDLITPSLHPAGTFVGRWIKVASRTNSGARYFQIAELRANAANWARGAAVTASGPTWPGLEAANLTDGSLTTLSHNLDLANTFSYQIRLTQHVAFTRLEIWNRDNCCPERLSDYRVSLHADSAGQIGAVLWAADVRADHSNAGLGGVDVLTAALDPVRSFEGQWIQIQNLDIGAPRYLQIAEVRAFGFAGHSGYASIIRGEVASVMKNLNASGYLRVPFNVSDPAAFDQLTLRIRYDDGFAAHVNGVEVARRNSPTSPAYNASATTEHFAGTGETFSVPASVLRNGTNLLAIQGLNSSAADRDFLLFPEMSSTATATLSPDSGHLFTPTPGGPNTSAATAGFVDDPQFNIDRGFFEAPFDVIISSPTPGATLVITTNSTTPTLLNGVVFVPPATNESVVATMRVVKTTVLRAAAFKSGFQSSKIDTHTYLFLADVIRQPNTPPGFPTTWNGFTADYQMDARVVTNAAYAGEIMAGLRAVPTMSIVVHQPDLFGTPNGIYTFSDQVGDAWERAASVELIRPDGSTGFQENCGVRLWGTGWRPHSSSPKHALQLKFKSEYGAARLRYPLFPDATVVEFDNIVLRAQGSRSWCDFRQPDREQTQYIHDTWARDTAAAMQKADGRATYVHLYLNGLYWGLYNPVEKTDDGWADAQYGGGKTNYDVITRRGAPEVDAGDLTAWNQMMAIVNAGLATPEQYALVQQHLDVDDFIDYMMLHQYASNHDGPLSTIANNMRAIRRRVPAGPFRFHVWDMEYTFWYPQEYNLAFDLDQCPARIFQRLRANPEFRLRFADHAHRHLANGGALTPGPAADRWRARAEEIVGAVIGESARWGDVRRATPPYTRNVEWTNELNRLLNEYFPVRTEILLGQYKAAGLYPAVAAPAFNLPGGDVAPGSTLSIAAPAGTVYYTLDGSDPRLFGGGISSNALGYTPTTPLVTTATVARVLVPSNDALGQTWNGSQSNFNDSTWLTGANAAGFDTSPAVTPATVPLQNATADFSENGRAVGLAIDASGTTGWGIFEAQDYLPKGRGAVAVFETATNIGYPEGTRLVLTLRHGAAGQLALGKFRLSITTDDRLLFADGLASRGDILANWTPLQPLSATAAAGGVMTVNAGATVLVSGANPATNAYTITAITPVTGITGFRLEALEDSTLPSNGPGRAANGNAVLTDFSVQAAPATLPHILDATFSDTLRAAMQNVNASAYVRLVFNAAASTNFDQLMLRVRYEDGFIAYLNGHEIARRNAPAAPAWNSSAAGDRAKGLALDFEEIDVTPGLPFLVSGANVLALHGFNDTAGSPDFLAQAELGAKTDQPIALADSMTIRARVLSGGEWSALQEATFTSRVPLRVTEVMFHPPNSGSVDGEEFEFLELKNTGLAPFNLGGLTFTRGIQFTFAPGTVLGPGQFFVLARNPAQFAARYPGVAVQGVYSGRLDNNGETLEISRPFGGPRVLSLTYGDAAPWPATADGLGFSLVPKNASVPADFDDPRNWRASANLLGSPGADDPAPTVPTMLINEILSASTPPAVDAIELFNPTGASVNVGGWFLTDDRTVPKKFQIPAGQTIAPGGFLVFTEADFNPLPVATNSFSFDSAGDSAYLFSGDGAGNLTGYSHGFPFGAVSPDVSFGRHVISTGEEHLAAQSASTFDGPNVAPRVGPVVISEIMYHPPPGGDEFVELQNIATTNVALFDPAAPANRWILGGLGFTFPSNVTMQAGSFALLVGGDPLVFRLKYGVPTNVLILGPWAGQLQNSGERLELQRPLPPVADIVSYETVDAVRYNDRAPWPPLADGFGPSLQRLDPGAYGNDPMHWRAAAPGIGLGFAGGVAPGITMNPGNHAVVRSQSAFFTVGASGTTPLQYQWQFNSTNLTGATNGTLLLTNVQLAQAGSYRATVFNSAGAVTSGVGILTVLLPPRILVQPTNRLVGPGSNATFSVAATGTGPLAYQWRFNGVVIPEATNSSHLVASAQFANAGDYTVEITDSVGSVLSSTATLYLLVPTTFLQQPLSQSVVVGGRVTLSAIVSGSPLPFGFDWRRGSVSQASNTVSSATSYFSFTMPNMVTSQQYRVIVKNLANLNPGVASAFATITTLADGDGDGMPDEWERGFELDPASNLDREIDTDGDSMLNWQEYIAGTDPADDQSYLRIESLAGAAGATVTFRALATKTYSVEYTDALDSGLWLHLGAVPGRPADRLEAVFDPDWTANRFYRITTPYSSTP
jgi:hypothetical protein